MPLFSDISTLRLTIQAALPGWRFQENPAVPDPSGGTAAGAFSLWTTPQGEQLVVLLLKTSLTGSERPKPQIRIVTERAREAYHYARVHGLRYFFLVYCATPPSQLKLPAGVDPSAYLVSIESRIPAAGAGRLDIRSMYDNLASLAGRDFFRVTPDMHSCPSLSQGSFLRIRGDTGAFTVRFLEEYLRYFDSRPYMADLSGGHRPVCTPSALYAPDPAPLELPWNLLVHGAPGTGKSHFLKESAQALEAAGRAVSRRVTFYEDYSYGQFVGEYLPVPQRDSVETVALEWGGSPLSGTISGEHITYRFSPGPLAELLADCFAAKLNGDPRKYILILEELNRANAASVFGDLFQLLDRERGVSVYSAAVRPELADYLYLAVSRRLADGAPELPEDAFAQLRLPDNLCLWATMNSADQGVFPLDSAFKRRWSYLYRDVYETDPAAALRPRIWLPVLDAATGSCVPFPADWDAFRGGINDAILREGFAEDRCIGYWFFSEEEMEAIRRCTEAAAENRNGAGGRSLSALPNPLVDKLFAYLVQDVFRNTPADFFRAGVHTLSQIRRALMDLQLNGEPMDIRSLVALPDGSFVENPPPES